MTSVSIPGLEHLHSRLNKSRLPVYVSGRHHGNVGHKENGVCYIESSGHETMDVSPAQTEHGAFHHQQGHELPFHSTQLQRTALKEFTNSHHASLNNSNAGYMSKVKKEQPIRSQANKVSLATRQHARILKATTPAGKKLKHKTKKHAHFNVPRPEMSVAPDELLSMDIDDPSQKIRNMMTKVPFGVVDIDDHDNPFSCPAYAQDVCDYLQAKERTHTFPENFLQADREVTPKMRAILMDWLIQVQVHLELSQDTLHMACRLVDRFLCAHHVGLSTLQLVGITCVLISAKYVERFPPEISELCHLTDNTYVASQVLGMERFILKKMNFEINVPDSTVFLERFMQIEQTPHDGTIKDMSCYMLDITLKLIDFVHFVPSMVAASAIYVSRRLMGLDETWHMGFAYYTKYSEKDILECVKLVAKALMADRNCKYQGAFKKYSNLSSFNAVATHPAILNTTLLKEVAQEETLIM